MIVNATFSSIGFSLIFNFMNASKLEKITERKAEQDKIILSSNSEGKNRILDTSSKKLQRWVWKVRAKLKNLLWINNCPCIMENF